MRKLGFEKRNCGRFSEKENKNINKDSFYRFSLYVVQD